MSDPTNDPRHLACVGASVTFGRGLADRRKECYPAVLQRLLDSRVGEGAWRVRNFGYSGATASRGSNEPYWDTPSFTSATRFAPHAAIVMLGTNDAQFANAAARASLPRDLADLVGHFRGLGAEVLLSDPPPAFPPVAEIDFDALRDVVRPAIRRVAAEREVPLVDFLTPLAGRREDFPDGLHPTAAVAESIAHIALAALVKEGIAR
ncbi:GDSL-type esterase/lipase family protein [Botrimarina sp.]|uniref:GDSL-type esterase/lipase family protein n=1 Tax=Botrimarina sp. TaxID=2795802 RepID=UPI0032EE6572